MEVWRQSGFLTEFGGVVYPGIKLRTCRNRGFIAVSALTPAQPGRHPCFNRDLNLIRTPFLVRYGQDRR